MLYIVHLESIYKDLDLDLDLGLAWLGLVWGQARRLSK